MPITTYPDSPYFDDFAASNVENKNYQQILFRPGYSVQVRELNQLQSMLRSQIDKLGSSFYTNGSPIIGGTTTFDRALDFVDIETSDTTPISIQSNGIVADVVGVESLELIAETHRFYIRYRTARQSGGSNVSLFVDSLAAYNTEDLVNSIGTVVNTGKCAAVFVDKGIFFVNGCFVVTDAQQTFLALENPTDTVSGYAAMRITESVVAATTDSTLFDNATGSPNFSAPGANRYAIDISLVFVQDTDTPPTYNFFKLLTVFESNVNNVKTLIDSSLDRKLAQRTYEESGNYCVQPFKVDVREYYNDGTNFGKYNSSQIGAMTPPVSVNTAKSRYIVGIEPSIAYVNGYRVQLTDRNDIVGNKARSTRSDQNLYFTAPQGNYILTTSVDFTSTLPDIHNSTTVYNLFKGTGAQTIRDTKVGTCKIRNMEYVSAGVYRVFIYDFAHADSLQLSDATVLTNGAQATGGSIILTNSAGFTLNDTANNKAIFPLPYETVKTITSLRYQVRRLFTVSLGGASSTFTIPHPTTGPAGNFIDNTVSNYIITNGAGTVLAPVSASINVINGITFTFSGNIPGGGGGAQTLYIIGSYEVVDKYNTKSALTASTPQVVTSATYAISTPVTETKTSASYSIGNSGTPSTITLAHTNVILHSITITDTTHSADVTNSFVINGATGVLTYNNSTTLASAALSITYSYNTPITLTNKDVDVSTVVITDTTHSTNVTSLFNIVSASNENQYGSAVLTYNNATPLTAALSIAYSYRPHQTTSGPFIVNSYGDSFDAIPLYQNVRLSDFIDFRANAAATNVVQIDPNSTIVASVEHYLPRIDTVAVNSSGKFFIVEGNPSLSPEIPEIGKDAMSLYNLFIPAYTYSTANILSTYLDNRRYTMRDIGTIEKRLSKVEYYTSLSLLERSANEKQILGDANSVRYKNGILVDSFFGHGTGDVENPAYQCSVDSVEGILRPKYESTLVDLKLPSSIPTGLVANANTVLLAYDEVTLIEQPYATASESVNPYDMTAWNGTVELSPSSDEWKSTITRPSVIMNDTSAYDAIAFSATASGVLGFHWNEWEVNWTGTRITQTAKHVVKVGKKLMRATTTDSGFSSIRNGTRTTLSYTDSIQSVSEKVVDISYVPFIRSRKIYFKAKRLKPNTRVYPFFDGVDISAYTVGTGVTHVDFKNQTDSTIYDGVAVGSLGITASSIVTDSTGKANGFFIIPNNSALKFKTGERSFKLIDDTDNESQIFTTIAETKYNSTGIIETKENTIVSTRVPQFDTARVSDTRWTSRFSKVKYDDPLAQSFILDQSVTSGAFITSIDVFFESISAKSIPVSVHLVSVQNGTPTQNIIPFSSVTLDAASCNLSPENEPATVATQFTFESPVYIQQGVEYAFVITSNDSDYRVYVSDTGAVDLITNKRITKNPYAGVLFKSQNGSTWTPDQNKDIKFLIRRAQFETGVARSITIAGKDQSGNPNATIQFSTIRTFVEKFRPEDTDIAWALNVDTDTYPIEVNANIDLYALYAVKRSKISLTASIITNNEWISPYIDCHRLSALLVNNLINNDTTNETTQDQGSATARYITRMVNLNDPANQLNIYVGANIPSSTTNIKVYAQLVVDDTPNYNAVVWTEISPTAIVPINTNTDEYSELSYQWPAVGAANTIPHFSSYRVKIVLLSSEVNSGVIPTIKDFRSIATYA